MRDIVKMGSYNAARHLGLDNKGVIGIGKDADVVICDDSINIKSTICRGILAYSA